MLNGVLFLHNLTSDLQRVAYYDKQAYPALLQSRVRVQVLRGTRNKSFEADVGSVTAECGAM